MVKQLKELVHRARYFREAVCAIVLLLVSFQPAFGATKLDGTLVLSDSKEQFMSTLATMPYTSSGAGPVLYVLGCSACPSSQAFERDWKGQLDGVEMRRILIAFNAATANETAYLARTRDINDFYAFMNHTKVAPPIKACNCPEDNKAIQAFKSVIDPFGKVLKPIMIKNGWPKDAPAFPQFMWETNGRAYVGAYSKNSFPEILSLLRSGTQTAQASAPPSRTPAHDSASTLTEASVVETKGQVMTADKNSANPAAAAPTSDSGSTSIGSAASGPDVIGLRIGMSPDEARAIFKSRVLTSDAMRKGYKELSSTLAWKVPGRGIQMPVSNGNYIQGFTANGSHDDQSVHNFTVWFSAVPGQEKLLSLSRSDDLLGSKKPTLGAFEKTLFEKYGTPTYRYEPDRSGGYYFMWNYDSNGKLHNPGFTKDLNSCNQPITAGWMWNDQEFEQQSVRCGAIFLIVNMGFDGTYVGRETLIRNYKVRMEGFDMAMRENKISRAIINKEQAAASEAAIKKGQQQKPEF
jgi:hypothetical protein